VTVHELDTHTDPQLQLDRHVTDHVFTSDSKSSLLIIYYSGFSMFYDDRRTLKFCGLMNPVKRKAQRLHPEADWNGMDEFLCSEKVLSDVLVILDTCYASNICQIETFPLRGGNASHESLIPTDTSTHVDFQKSVELMAASGINETTAAPGKYSFTRALIDALNRLLDEDPDSSFTTWHLIQMIQRSPERADTTSQLWSRLPNRHGRHIRLGMLQGHTVHGSKQTISSQMARKQSTSGQGASSQDLFAQHSSEVDTDDIKVAKRQHDAISSQDRNIYGDDDSAYESGFSDTASIWSVAFSEDSQSSYGELQHVTQSATKKMAEVFWQNSELHSLYQEVSTKFPMEAFQKLHDDMLKMFFENLRLETANDKQLKTVRILRHRARRQQVTEWIYNLASPKLDNATLQARQNFLTQRDTRDEMLERYLQAQTRPGKVDEQDEHVPINENGSSGDEDEDPISLEELDSIINFLIGGQSFEVFKINLYSVAHPETAIVEALRTGSYEILQSLLTKNFNRVAVGQYAWIKELDAAGYKKVDIAQLLIEETTESPWIFFTPPATETFRFSICDPLFHVAECIHSNRPPHPHMAKAEALAQSESLIHIVHQLCGLAGVVPSSKDKESWNGHVQFADDNSVAKVTYAMPSSHSRDIDDALLARCIHTLQMLVLAAGCLQASQVCCNSYTVIGHDDVPVFKEPSESKHISTVRLHRIEMSCLLKLLKDAQVMKEITNMQELQRADVKNLQEAALGILGVLGRHHFPLLAQLTYRETLHLVALATQFASLGVLAYSQAHLAPIQPFFMDTPLREVMLMGIGDPQQNVFHINARMTSLTCIGDMLRSEVVVFSVQPMRSFGDSPSYGPQIACKYDVIASAEDLIGKLISYMHICSTLIALVYRYMGRWGSNSLR
jgi:hypothetical protein